MPKQVYNILSFHGGISNDADPRDIADKQFADLQNVAIDEVGKIIVLGDIKTTHFTQAGAITVPGGRGLMSIKTDYDNFMTAADAIAGVGSGAAAITPGTNGGKYYITEGAEKVTIGSQTGVADTADETVDDLPVDNLAEASMYWAKGALRIYDADHTTDVVPTWRGFIKGVLYGTDSGTPAYAGHVFRNATAAGVSGAVDQWYTLPAQINGCFQPVTIETAQSLSLTTGLNLIMGQGQDVRDGITDTNPSPTPVFGFANEACMTGTGPANQPGGSSGSPGSTASGMYWGLGMHYNPSGEGSWAPTGTESYQFYCTTIYDGNQESSPQLFTMYPSGYQAEKQSSDDTHGPSNNTASANSYCNATIEPHIIFGEATEHNDRATNIGVKFMPTIKWIHPAHGDTTAETAVIYNFGAIGHDSDGISTGVGNAGLQNGGNPRITGLRCYWASSEDGFSDLWELWEWDFEKGFKSAAGSGGGAGGYALTDFTSSHLGTLDASSSYYYYHHPHAGEGGLAGVIYTEPPRVVRYTDTNGHTAEELLSVESFKAVTIASGRAWIGNVKIDGVQYGDAMISSKGGQYDKFPTETNRENVIVNDGDNIVALAEYADRVLQFKENVLYILNVTGEYVGLEAKHTYKGVSNPGAVCRTDYGVAWANAFGCYVYDGQKVIDLLDEGGLRKINKNTWSTHIGTANYHRVGFNPNKRQIIVTAGGSGSGAAYIYDMITKSWTYSSSLITDPNTGSNFINDLETGDLLIHDGAGTIDKWVDTPTSDPTISIKTKDIDFGQPSVRKKIYKVYVSYKGDGSAVTIQYSVNGDADIPGGASATLSPFYRTTADGSSDKTNSDTTPLLASDTDDWIKAELKPVSSINNKNSFSLTFGGTAATDFEINDISIVYRLKNVK